MQTLSTPDQVIYLVEAAGIFVVAVAFVAYLAGALRGAPNYKALSMSLMAAGLVCALVVLPKTTKASGEHFGTPSASKSGSSPTPPPSPTRSSDHGAHLDTNTLWTALAAVGVTLLLILVLTLVGWLVSQNRRRRARYERLMTRWDQAASVGDAATDTWLSYDKDMHALLRAPAMRNYAQPTTLAAAEALGEFDAIAHRSPRRGDDLADTLVTVETFEQAAKRWKFALEAAVRYAKFEALSTLSTTERSSLERARAALNIALDVAASETERMGALRVVRSVLDRLGVEPSERLMVQIERQVRSQIEAPV